MCRGVPEVRSVMLDDASHSWREGIGGPVKAALARAEEPEGQRRLVWASPSGEFVGSSLAVRCSSATVVSSTRDTIALARIRQPSNARCCVVSASRDRVVIADGCPLRGHRTVGYQSLRGGHLVGT